MEDLDLLFAEQQFTGFSEGICTANIIALVQAMGLTKSEWEELKRKKMVSSLREKDIEILNKHFSEKKHGNNK